MATMKLILEENGTNEFDFFDGSITSVVPGFSIPSATLSTSGEARRKRGLKLGLADYSPLEINIPFIIDGSSKSDLLAKQRVLIAALNKPRNVLTWNPDPATCDDVYFDTYSSQFESPLDFSYFLQDSGVLTLKILSDPFPYPAETTIFDEVKVLGQVDGESGQWTASNDTGANAPEDSTRYRQGSKSARTEITAGANSWVRRDAAVPQNLVKPDEALIASLPHNLVTHSDMTVCSAGPNAHGDYIPDGFSLYKSGFNVANFYYSKVDVTDNYIGVSAPTGAVVGDVLVFTTTGTLPSPLVAGTHYYIIQIGGGYFLFSATPGGAAVDFTDQGTGTHTATLGDYSITQEYHADGWWTKIQVTSASASEFVGLSKTAIPIVAGDVVSYRVEYKCVTPVGCGYTGQFYEIGGTTPDGLSVATATTAQEFKKENQTVSAGTTSITINFYMYFGSNGTNTGTFWVRNAMAVKAAALPTLDGATRYYDDLYTQVPGLPEENWVTAALQLDSVPSTLESFDIYIGSNTGHYRRYDITSAFGMAGFVPGWQLLFFNLNAPTATVGTPVMAAMAYLYIEANVASGNGPAFNIDNVHLINGKVCNVRGQTPLSTTIYDVGGEYDCGFKLDMKAGAGAQFLISADNGETIGEYTKDGNPGADSVSFVVNNPYGYQVTEGLHALSYFASAQRSGASGFHRVPTVGLDLSAFTAGTVSFDVAGTVRDNTSAYNDLTMEIRIGNDVTHYVKATKTLFGAGIYWTAHHPTSFNIADMVAGVGAVTWTSAINYIGVSFSRASGTWAGEVHIDNMYICDLGSWLDLITIAAGDGLEAAPGVISLPESSPTAPYGHTWEATPAPTAMAGAFGGKYYRWTTATAGEEKHIYPAQLAGDLYPGEHNILIRVRTSDADGGTLRLCGYDAHSGEWSFGEPVAVGYIGAHFQTVNLGALNLPFDGWHRDAAPASMFSILGVAVTSVGATKTWDINVLMAACVERGARQFTPAVGQRFNCFDTRYIDSELYTQGSGPLPNAMSGARRRTTGDLMTLAVGINNLMISASDSSEPDICSSIDLTKLTTVHRLKNGAA